MAKSRSKRVRRRRTISARRVKGVSRGKKIGDTTRRVELFEAFAKRQTRIKNPDRRNSYKLAQLLVPAFRGSLQLGDTTLVGRTVVAALPLIRDAKYFAVLGDNWLVDIWGKLAYVQRNFQRCRRKYRRSRFLREACFANVLARASMCNTTDIDP